MGYRNISSSDRCFYQEDHQHRLHAPVALNLPKNNSVFANPNLIQNSTIEVKT